MAIKHIYLLYVFLFVAFQSKAQQGFNKIYDFYPGVDEFNQLFVDENAIISIGVAYDTLNWPSPLKIMMVKIDTFGYTIKSRLFKDTLNDYLSTDFLWGDIIKTTQGYYAFYATALNRGANLLIQIDSNLQVQKLFEHYGGQGDNTPFCHGILELQDNSFLIFGSVQRSNLKNDGFVRRIDKFGHQIWFKYYGNYFADEGFAAMVKINDNRFLIGGGAVPGPSLWVIDSNGVVLQQKTVPLSYPYQGSIGGLIRSTNGSGTIAYGAVDLGIGQWGPKVKSFILKLNDALELEWFKYVGPSSTQYNIFLDITSTPDGHYIAAGERNSYGFPAQPSNDWGGWMFKFSEEGDSLWSRADNAPLPYIATGEFVYGGVGVLPSGSVIAGGRGDVDNHPVGFVVKVSPDGCLDTLLCQTSGSKSPVPGPEKIGVFPNPTTGLLQISIPLAAASIQLEILDMTGRLLATQTLPVKINTVSLKGLTSGVLALIFKENGQIIHTEKVLLH